MTFHSSVASGVFGPHDLTVLKHVFDVVSGCPWFRDSDDCRDQFATYLVHRYRGGLCDPDALRVDSATLAYKRFSESMH
jgi:hypothetical protein